MMLLELSPGVFLDAGAVQLVAEGRPECDPKSYVGAPEAHIGRPFCYRMFPGRALIVREDAVAVLLAGCETPLMLYGEDAKILMAYLDDRRR